MGELLNRTALVTGSSRGIGRAVAERLAEEGALVVVHYATARRQAEEVVAHVIARGGQAMAVRAEFGRPGDVDELFEAVEAGLKEHTGNVRLDIVVNNAGTTLPFPPEETTQEQFDRVMAVNARAPFFVVQRALRLMPDGGRIVNISSGLTRFANPRETVYAMSKAALEMITLNYARQLGSRGITVNTVAPGITDNGSEIFSVPTAVIEMSKLAALEGIARPDDIAGTVAFLVSPRARWITGAFIDCTGGSLLG